MATSNPFPPTPRQLRCLRALAERTGTTFVYPATRAQASSQIRSLRSRPRDARAPWQELQAQDRDALGYGTAVHPSEVSGYGASAHWRGSQVEPEVPR
jgi:hypothetical protein